MRRLGRTRSRPRGGKKMGRQEIGLFKLLAMFFDLLRQLFRVGFGFGASCARAAASHQVSPTDKHAQRMKMRHDESVLWQHQGARWCCSVHDTAPSLPKSSQALVVAAGIRMRGAKQRVYRTPILGTRFCRLLGIASSFRRSGDTPAALSFI